MMRSIAVGGPVPELERVDVEAGVPGAVEHLLPARIAGRLQLLDGDVPVGVAVVLGDAVLDHQLSRCVSATGFAVCRARSIGLA